MTEFIAAEDFEVILAEDFEKLLRPGVEFNVLVRPEERREFYRGEMGPACEMPRPPLGDVVVGRSFHALYEPFYLGIGARFDLDDLAESFMRQRAYDIIFHYSNAHIRDRGSKVLHGPFTDDTPFMTFGLTSGLRKSEGVEAVLGLQQRLASKYFYAKKYLQTIDSPGFRQLVEEVKVRVDSGIVGILSDGKVLVS